MTLGKILTVLRENLKDHPSQTKVGFDIFGKNKSKNSVQSKMKRIEAGEQEPTVSELKKFAKYFDVSVYYLLDLTESEEMNDLRKRMTEKTFPGSFGETAGTKQKAM